MRSHTLHSTTFSLIVTSMLLAGCGGNAAAPRSSAAQISQLIDLQGKVIEQIGAVEFMTHMTTFGGSEYLLTETRAGFLEYDLPLNSADLSKIENVVNGSVAGCSTVDVSNSIFETFSPHGRGVQAGEIITVTTPSGSWPELVSHSELVGSYLTREHEWTNAALPSGSTIDIPGGDFPPFAAVTVQSVQLMSELGIENLANLYLQPDSQVMWKAGEDPMVWVNIRMELSEYDADENTETNLVVHCRARDTGTFTFPENVQALLGKYNFEKNDVFVNRTTWSYKINGNALLLIANIAQSVPR